jgi:hypothetical protein
MHRSLLPLSLTAMLLGAVVGCKKSETAAVPAATPAPVARFQIKPPATLGSDKVPFDRPSEFTLSGNAGQALRIELEGGGREGNDSPTVSLQAGGGTAIKAITEDSCPGDSVFPFAQTGTYRVLFNPGGRRKNVRFTLLEGTDPLLSSGIEPAQVSIDFGAAEKGKTVEGKSLEITCEVGESWPAHLLIVSKHFSLRIMQTAGYEELFRRQKDMALLRASLRPDAKPVDAKDLPYAGSDDAAAVMTARPELIKGSGWRGWRWLEGQAQDGDYPAGEGLGYTFEGITDDGRLFIRARTGISHPDLKRIHPSDTVGDNDTELRLLLEKSLAVAAPSSFKPNLDQLDAVIRSLKIRR